MSVSTSIPRTARPARSTRLVIVAAVAAVIVAVAWAIATYAASSGSRATNHGTPTQASVLSVLTPQQRQYVLGIAAMSPAQLQAAFGTVQPSANGASMRSLTPRERRYVRALASMSSSELAAAFGTGR
jgi:hypothetical protein